MDLTPYVDALRSELVVAAEAGGEDARALAERLVAPLETATRLALLEALSAAADEITLDLAPGSVEVRLRGRNPDFVVTAPDNWSGRRSKAHWTDFRPVDLVVGIQPPAPPAPPDPPDAPSPPEPPPTPDAEEGGTARITLRLPTHLKPRIDEAASRMGLSVNQWLVRAISAALTPDDRGHDYDRRQGSQFGRRYSGWVR